MATRTQRRLTCTSILKITLTVGGLDPEFGGPSQNVPALAEALAREGIDVDVFACESEPGHNAPVLSDAKLVKTQLLPVRSRCGRWRASRNDFFHSIRETAGSDTVIHDNGLWLPSNHAVACAARYSTLPLLISPRGMLSEWARKHHAWKKRVAWALFQRRDLQSAATLHATSQEEAADCRRAGFTGPVAVIPNGVTVPQLPRIARTQSPTKIALCISRIHPKKGLLLWIDAWAQVRPAGWRMVIAGNDENGHTAELKKAVTAHGLNGAFEFVGSVEGEQKWRIHQQADLFVLPSHSENFGVVVAEALACGVPVITTRGTPWREIIEHRCGWWEDVGTAPLARALREAMALSDGERRAMGCRGRELVAQKYSWPGIAAQMHAVYRWMLRQGSKPDCIS